ncbi:hypothetical protein AVEN_45172-1, partial [Araneus ventricosus]
RSWSPAKELLAGPPEHSPGLPSPTAMLENERMTRPPKSRRETQKQ